MNDRDVPEALLVRRAREGDPEAFRMIIRTHGPAVRRYLGALFRDDAAADEGTQETFVRAHAHLRALAEPSRLRSWLLGIARIVWLDGAARSRREVIVSEPVLPDEPSPLESPETSLLGAEAETVLAEALATLQPHRRAALLLRIDQRLPYAEIAEQLGWPESKVKNEIHRGRLQIRQRLVDYLRGKS